VSARVTSFTIAAVLCLATAASAQMTAGVPNRLGPAAAPAGFPAIGETLYSFPAPGPWPAGLVWDGTGFWHTDIDSAWLCKTDTTGAVLKMLPLPPGCSGPADLEWIAPHLWMVEENRAWLYELDTADGSVLKALRLPDSASVDGSSWGLAWDGTHFWHSEYGDPHKIYQLDTADASVLAEFNSPTMFTLGIAWDGTYLWCTDITDCTCRKVEVPSGNVLETYAWQVPYSLGMKNVNGAMWCASGRGTARIYKVDCGGAGLAGNLDARPPLRMGAPRPNPFVRTTRLAISGPGADQCRVAVFDAQGRRVRGLDAGTAGELSWDGTDDAGRRLAAGVYLVRALFRDGSVEQQSVRLAR